MVKYKVKVSIDEQNKFWIVVDKGRFIRNHTEDDLKDTKIKSYSPTNVCPRCREENNITDKSILYPGNANHDIDKNGKKIDEWVCKMHNLRHYHRYDPGSNTNIKKSMRPCRTGGPKYHNQMLADDCENITKEWLGVKRLNVEYDKYSQLPFDHDSISKHILMMIGDELVDLYGKVPQTKGASLTGLEYEIWSRRVVNEHGKKFDILIFYCIGEYGNTIERIYIIPYSEIIKRPTVAVYKNSSRVQWSEKYRVTDENEIKKADEIYGEILEKRKKKQTR